MKQTKMKYKRAIKKIEEFKKWDNRRLILEEITNYDNISSRESEEDILKEVFKGRKYEELTEQGRDLLRDIYLFMMGVEWHTISKVFEYLNKPKKDIKKP